MTDAAQVALLVLAGLLTGLLIPVLLSARSFFRRTERLVEEVEPKLDEALVDLRALVRRGDTLVESLEPAVPRATHVIESLDRLADGIEDLRESSALARSIGRAIGPAVIAAWSAYRAHKAMMEQVVDDVAAESQEVSSASWPGERQQARAEQGSAHASQVNGDDLDDRVVSGAVSTKPHERGPAVATAP